MLETGVRPDPREQSLQAKRCYGCVSEHRRRRGTNLNQGLTRNRRSHSTRLPGAVVADEAVVVKKAMKVAGAKGGTLRLEIGVNYGRF